MYYKMYKFNKYSGILNVINQKNPTIYRSNTQTNSKTIIIFKTQIS